MSAAAFACSAPGPGSDAHDANLGGVGGQASSGLAGTNSAASGAGGLAPAVGGTAPVGSGGVANGGSAASQAGSGGVAVAGAGGTLAAGSHSGGASGGGHAGNAGNGGGGAGANAVCPMVKAEYAAELEKQLGCNPNAGSQCTNKVAAAPGCECRVFMQPTDPFAIEHLSNLANGWFDADCSMPSCPAKCSTAAAGTCQADAKSSLGGRCVTP